MDRRRHRLPIATRHLAVALAAAVIATLTGCAAAPGTVGTVVELEVASQRVPCEGEGEMACLRVRRGGSDDWELFYDDITGFTHQPGTEYVLRVLVTTVDDPPADGSSLAYTLVEVVDERSVDGS